MIEVERLNHENVFINPDLLRVIEKTPDTLLIFSDGQKMLVRDSPEEIVAKIVNYRKCCQLEGAG